MKGNSKNINNFINQVYFLHPVTMCQLVFINGSDSKILSLFSKLLHRCTGNLKST